MVNSPHLSQKLNKTLPWPIRLDHSLKFVIKLNILGTNHGCHPACMKPTQTGS